MALTLVESWKVGDQVFSTTIQDVQGLVDAMRNWDPEANWKLDAATFTIMGENTGKVYGDMMIKQINTGSASPEISPNVQFLPAGTSLKLAVGTHNLVITNNEDGCEYQLNITVTCGDQCPTIYDGSSEIAATDCDGLTDVCLGINPLEIPNYLIFDNGVAYDNEWTGCDFDTVVSYLYFTIPDRGENGPYLLESWKVNDQEFSTIFDSINELVDSMNAWDPIGDWKLDAPTFTIMGDNSGNDYGDMMVKQIDSGARSPEISPNLQFIPFGTALQLEAGIHNLVITNTVTGCIDSLSLNISCNLNTFGEVIDTVIYVGETDTLCVDLGELGDITGVNNLCPGAADGNVDIALIPNTNCIEYTGLSVGRDSFCLEICDINGLCDTTTIIVEVLPVRLDADTIRREVLIGFVDTVCVTSSILQTEVESITNSCPDSSGTFVDFNPIDGTSCMEFIGDAIGEEQACIVICDSLQNCDTTILIVNVIPPSIDTIEAIVSIDSIATYCIDTTELAGTIDTIYNYCEELSGDNAEIIIDTDSLCIDVMGVTVGQDTACIVICDDRGLCDTTIFFLDIVPLGMPPIAVDDDTMTVRGGSITIPVTVNDTLNGDATVGVLDESENGMVVTNSDNSITYIPDEEFCGAIDSFTYVLTNNFGSDTATVFVEVLCDELTIFSGFSPNGDGVNEVFTILGIEAFPNNRVCVFNRWGNQVFQQDGYRNTWTGDFNGKLLPDGTYFYVVDDGEGKKYSGYVQIQR